MSISLHQITKRFAGVPAVSELDAEIANGTFFVVLGPSGCGKSTLLRLIAGLEALDEGHIRLGNQDVAGRSLHLPPEERGVGVVFQSYALWPHMSVRRNVAFPLEARGSSRRAAEQAADGHLATVALTPYADRRPADLSGGQRQRVALARCLASEARVVLMDEPLANLDPHLRHTMEGELAAFHRTSGATTLYITHDQREAMALADRIAVMRDGRFEQVAAPADIYARPATAFVADFVGTGSIVTGTATGQSNNGRIAVRIGPIDLPCEGSAEPGQTVQVLLRPEWITTAGDAQANGSVPATGRVESATYRGGHWECRLRLEGLDEGLLVHADDGMQSPRAGDSMPLRANRGWILPGG